MLAHAAFGLMNSTPFLSGEVDRARCAELLRAATLAALQSAQTGPDWPTMGAPRPARCDGVWSVTSIHSLWISLWTGLRLAARLVGRLARRLR